MKLDRNMSSFLFDTQFIWCLSIIIYHLIKGISLPLTFGYASLRYRVGRRLGEIFGEEFTVNRSLSCSIKKKFVKGALENTSDTTRLLRNRFVLLFKYLRSTLALNRYYTCLNWINCETSAPSWNSFESKFLNKDL